MFRFARRYVLLPCAATLISSGSAWACASCGCSLSTDAATGYSSVPGWRVTLQFDYIDQDQLRAGTGSVSPATVAALNNPGGPGQEVEHETVNRYTTFSLSYRPTADYGFNLLVPYVDRNHTTYGEATPDLLTPDQLSGATVKGLGDVRVIANYQGFLSTHNAGIQFGIKLPTGNYGGPNAAGTGVVGRHPAVFTTGPNSQAPVPDNTLDTSLQAGTGTTDIIVGGYYYRAVSQDYDTFVNAQYQMAVAQKLDTPGEDFRPGDFAAVNTGLRYVANPQWVPQLQLNITHRNHDEGALADVGDSAGTAVYLSPGITANMAKVWQVYGFVQVPVYSRLSGYQLFPHWTASVGLSRGF